MNLVPWAFQAVAAGRKTVEMRLCDEKRSSIRVGDKIEFENNETGEKLLCEVVGLTRFRDFFALYASYEKVALGYTVGERADPEDMYAYYPPERIEQYGVLAIEIKTS